MKTIKALNKTWKINIKVKSTKITVKETSTFFQRVVLFVVQSKEISQEIKNNFFKELNQFISEAKSQYDKIDSEAWSQYDKIRSEAWSQYDKIRSEAKSQYDKIRSEAWSLTTKIKELMVKFKINYRGK